MADDFQYDYDAMMAIYDDMVGVGKRMDEQCDQMAADTTKLLGEIVGSNADQYAAKSHELDGLIKQLRDELTKDMNELQEKFERMKHADKAASGNF